MVCIRYVGDLINDNIIRHYFIQGVDLASTIREVLSERLVTLNDVVQSAFDIEVIDKENERMVKRTDNSIPIHHQGMDSLTYHSSLSKIFSSLVIQESMLSLIALVDQLRTEMRQVLTDMTHTIRELTEQTACIVKGQNQQAPSRFHEL